MVPQERAYASQQVGVSFADAMALSDAGLLASTMELMPFPSGSFTLSGIPSHQSGRLSAMSARVGTRIPDFPSTLH